MWLLLLKPKPEPLQRLMLTCRRNFSRRPWWKYSYRGRPSPVPQQGAVKWILWDGVQLDPPRALLTWQPDTGWSSACWEYYSRELQGMLKECGYVKEMEKKCNYKYILYIVLFLASLVESHCSFMARLWFSVGAMQSFAELSLTSQVTVLIICITTGHVCYCCSCFAPALEKIWCMCKQCAPGLLEVHMLL